MGAPKADKFPLRHIAIEGPIGVGKTSLAGLLARRFSGTQILEDVGNPFLTDFYAGKKGAAFQAQIYFLLSRYRQQREIAQMDLFENLVLADYTFAKDSLFARINLKGDELEMYYKVHEALGEKIPKPDLIVYLRADTDVLMQRIALRDRSYERNMERSYIDQLNHAYEDFFGKPYDSTPVLTIDTNPLNIVQNPEHLKLIESRIRHTLNLSPFQPSLPLDK